LSQAMVELSCVTDDMCGSIHLALDLLLHAQQLQQTAKHLLYIVKCVS